MLGFVLMQGAINFAVSSSGATSMHLVLFTESDLAAGKATHEITLDPAYNKTGRWEPSTDTSASREEVQVEAGQHRPWQLSWGCPSTTRLAWQWAATKA